MLDLFIKSSVIFFVMLLAIRLMGKRQLGELQPFEFVITLLIANVASVPIVDRQVPVIDGIIPIITLYFGHCLIVLLSLCSVKSRRVINGKPLTLITPRGIEADALKKANINVNDLVSALRQQGYFSPEDVGYALLETNGKISVLSNKTLEQRVAELPYTLIAEGKIMERNLALLRIDKFAVYEVLEEYDLPVSKVVLLTITQSGNTYLQPYDQQFVCGKSCLFGGL